MTNIGDKISWGHYPQGAGGEVLPLQWQVLAVRGGYALLMTDKLIDCLPFHDGEGAVTWEHCSLRHWLNTSFFDAAFTEEERGRIAAVTLQNPGQARFETAGGNPTVDRVFALSLDEFTHYFALGTERKAYATPYAAQKRASAGSGALWWLRSTGGSQRHAANVHFIGGVNAYGSEVGDGSVAIRPAMWLQEHL